DQRAGRSTHRSRSTRRQGEGRSPEHSCGHALLPQIEHHYGVVFNNAGKPCAQVLAQPNIVVKPPKSRPSEYDELCARFPQPFQFLNGILIVTRITPILAVAFQERYTLATRHRRICLPLILINEDERSPEWYKRHDVPRCSLDSMGPGVGFPSISIYRDPEIVAVFGGSFRCIIEKRQIEPEPLFKFQRLVAIVSMHPIASLWFLDLLHSPMNRRQSGKIQLWAWPCRPTC